MTILAFFLLSLCVAAGGALLAAHRQWLPERQTHRSSHAGGASRAGGLILLGTSAIVILSAWLAGLIAPDRPVTILLGCAGLAGLVGLIDDHHPISPLVKFLGQLVPAVLFVALTGGIDALPVPGMGDVPLGPAGLALGIFWIVALINTINFMDGINGIVAMAAIVGLGSVSIALGFGGGADTVWLPLICGGAIAGFGAVNILTGRVFLGDGGSHLIGFLLAGLALLLPSLASATDGFRLFLLIPIALIPFILDVMLTLLARWRRGERLTQAHRDHLYQKLASRWRGHYKVAGLYGGAVALCTIAGFTAITYAPTMLWVYVAGLCVIMNTAGLMLSRDGGATDQ